MKSIKVCEYSRSMSFHYDLILQDQASGERSQDQWSSGSFSLIEISVTDFSASIYASFFKFCIHLDSVKVYCVRENQIASICFSILFPLCSFSICHSCIMNMKISVKNFSETV